MIFKTIYLFIMSTYLARLFECSKFKKVGHPEKRGVLSSSHNEIVYYIITKDKNVGKIVENIDEKSDIGDGRNDNEDQ